MVVTAKRGGTEKKVLKFDAVKMNVNKMEISFATQLFIDGKFVDATSGRKLELVWMLQDFLSPTLLAMKLKRLSMGKS